MNIKSNKLIYGLINEHLFTHKCTFQAMHERMEQCNNVCCFPGGKSDKIFDIVRNAELALQKNFFFFFCEEILCCSLL